MVAGAGGVDGEVESGKLSVAAPREKAAGSHGIPPSPISHKRFIGKDSRGGYLCSLSKRQWSFQTELGASPEIGGFSKPRSEWWSVTI